ncbi:hypothetical protein [Caulobacter sp. UNC358MFTsu5.1]|uniref:hypothetical protein n=1 Tax=Caulobacter sp. UNC358MFTsu5.1 TaxID=1449049 RepID=UPI0012DD6B58|nr:hypothetical protein [Caulobacter sp. UNC358MFTsu5.1]
MRGPRGRRRTTPLLGLALALTAAACGTRAEPGPAWLARWNGPATVMAQAVELPLERAAPEALRGAATGPVTLVLTGLKAETPSGATYNLFVGPSGPARAATGDPGYVGALSLYDLAGRSEGADRVFPLPPQVRAALSAESGRPLVLTIVPRGGDGSPLVVTGARLVRQSQD